MIGSLLLAASLLLTPVAAIGDSITAGVGTANPKTQAYPVQAGVMSVGRGGSCLVTVGCGDPRRLVDTFAEEIAELPTKPAFVVVEIGVNDLAHVTDEQLMAAYVNLVGQGRAMGIRVIIGTIPPSNKTWPWHAAIQPQRLRVNALIRQRQEYVDYAAVLGGNLQRLRADYDGGDGLHPNAAGAAAMAGALTSWLRTHGVR